MHTSTYLENYAKGYTADAKRRDAPSNGVGPSGVHVVAVLKQVDTVHNKI